MDRGASDNTWNKVLGRIQGKLNSHSYNTWFKPTSFLDEDAASVRVRVPNSWFADWLDANYRGIIEDALREVRREGVRVDFRPEVSEGRAPSTDPDRPDAPTPAPAPTRGPLGPGSWLNPRYTFGSFVVSSCNQFAHAAARAVAEQPTRAYNPLYIYGGVGLGKTHLMQAIGNQVARSGKLRMHYVSSEHFMNELINAIRFERTLEFKERYRNVELLLIDDIQFLAGKERTQEEFFHTFNTLYDAQKQIVITSDVSPREIPTLEDRLRSRFEWGLIADIQPPDLETKVAILRKKAEADGVALPDDVALFIASKCTSNIRELEGALIRVVAYASVKHSSISIELARETLRDLLTCGAPAVTTEGIQKTVADYYNLKVSELKSKNNSHHVSFPRQIAMYLCKQLTGASLPEIGRRFGGKHHTTVLHAIKKIEGRRAQERDFDRVVTRLMESLK